MKFSWLPGRSQDRKKDAVWDRSEAHQQGFQAVAGPSYPSYRSRAVEVLELFPGFPSTVWFMWWAWKKQDLQVQLGD